jgi:hypothetical protein
VRSNAATFIERSFPEAAECARKIATKRENGGDYGIRL